MDHRATAAELLSPPQCHSYHIKEHNMQWLWWLRVSGELDPLVDRQDTVGGNTEKALKNLNSRRTNGYFRTSETSEKCVSTAIRGRAEGGT